ncbi:MAG: TRAM domain-containing protein [Tissierellia bacterium]|nr:TRAM domain-containing protein [Tissierellia bacterium]
MDNNKKIFKVITRIIITSLGFIIGLAIFSQIEKGDFIFITTPISINFWVKIGISFIIAIIFYLLTPNFLNLFKNILDALEQNLTNRPVSEIILGSVGLIIGLIIAYLISQLIYYINIPYISNVLSTLVYIALGYLGIKIATINRENLSNIAKEIGAFRRTPSSEKTKTTSKSTPKILDTSVIIDGRILEILNTGFLEGSIVIPVFVLEELQHIADSSDALKRNRGRRGLDIIAEIQKNESLDIIIHENKINDIPEVDSKLLKLTQILKGKIVTNDFNLNKVAEVQGIDVLNINELANAVKPIALPGEAMNVRIVKEGKESKQGLAYLDDGTMIVVEDGRDLIGETVDVIVTSVLQTAAGKMIFARPK